MCVWEVQVPYQIQPALATVSATGVVTGVAAGTPVITYRVTNNVTGCARAVSQTVTVNPLPSATLTVQATACVGDKVTASINYGTNAIVYTKPPLTNIGGAGYQGGFSEWGNVSVSGNYVLKVTNAQGCITTITKPLTVNPLPSAALTVQATACVGDKVTTSINYGTNAIVYTKPPLTNIGGAGYQGGFSEWGNVSVSGNYVLKVTSPQGCVTTITKPLTVNPLPTITVSSVLTTPSCTNPVYTLTASGANTYNWTPATGLSATNTAIVTARPTATTTYTVTGNANGCSASVPKVVDISTGVLAAIPDANYRAALKVIYPQCFVGDLLDVCCAKQQTGTQNVSGKNIASIEGVQYFEKITTLECRSNLLNILPVLSSNLTYLDCGDNQLANLSVLPSSLKTLHCNNNYLATLPNLPNTLELLNCEHNQIVALPTLSNSLVLLYCRMNQLASLPALPSTLTQIDCFDNLLVNLPSLPSSLNSLVCGKNHLISLPLLPSSLKDLDCYWNNLTSLPPLPCLRNLYCPYNCLTTLPSVGACAIGWETAPQYTSCTSSRLSDSEKNVELESSGKKDILFIVPNPSSEYISVNLAGTKVIYNTIGEEIMRTNESTINIEKLASGLYHLQVHKGNDMQKLSFIKR
jgi:hypothetical protein